MYFYHPLLLVREGPRSGAAGGGEAACGGLKLIANFLLLALDSTLRI